MSGLKKSVFFNKVHPEAAYIKKLDTNVQEYVAQLKSEYPNHHLILRAMNNEDIKDYIRAGFIEFRRTYEQDVDISDVIDYLSTHIKEGPDSGFKFDESLLTKSYNIYKETHMANPMADMSLEDWKALISPDLDHEHSIVIYDDMGNITAFLLMYDATEQSKDIGYVYFSDVAAQGRLCSLLNIKLTHLAKLGVTELSLEVDNTDRYAYELFESLLIHDEPYMRTLILR